MAQPTKRRRLDAAATLSKPFKSPMRRSTASTNIQPSTPISKETQTPATPNIPLEHDLTPNSSIAIAPVLTARKPILTPKLSIPKPFQPSDPEILALQKQQRAIQSRLAALRSELDNANQALKLESSHKDTELEALIVKWRLASQNAADEAFTGAQERVIRMGGMAAWKERSKRDATRWEFDEERNEREHVDEYEIDPREIENLPDEKNGPENEENQDEVGLCLAWFGFYMLKFLLRSLLWSPC
jgi:Swi5-dependent recombination DNA repair protein 1